MQSLLFAAVKHNKFKIDCAKITEQFDTSNSNLYMFGFKGAVLFLQPSAAVT